MLGHEVLGTGKKAGFVERIKEDVDRHGVARNLADPLAKTLPGVLPGLAKTGLFGLRPRFLDRAGRGIVPQGKAGDNADQHGAADGGAQGQAQIHKGSAPDDGHHDEEGGGQVCEVAGQTVEEVGQDQDLFADAPLAVALGQERVGCHAGYKGNGKGGPHHLRQAGEERGQVNAAWDAADGCAPLYLLGCWRERGGLPGVNRQSGAGTHEIRPEAALPGPLIGAGAGSAGGRERHCTG